MNILHLDRIVQCFSSVSGHLGKFPSFIPQMPLTHPDDPLNSEFGEISSLEESHEDTTENGDRAPGICSHYLFGSKQTCVTDGYKMDQF